MCRRTERFPVRILFLENFEEVPHPGNPKVGVLEDVLSVKDIQKVFFSTKLSEGRLFQEVF